MIHLIIPYDWPREWGIGGEQDNGVLIYIAVEDRKIAIQTGYGAEGFLPDAMANRIITISCNLPSGRGAITKD